MGRIAAAKKLWAMSGRLKGQRPGSRLLYFLDAVDASIRHGASPENYFVLRFFDLSQAQRGTYLTSGRSKAADKLLNAGAEPSQRRILSYKPAFLRAFPELTGRDFLEGPAAGPEDVEAFLKRHEDFILKPCRGTMGRGLERLLSRDQDPVSLHRRLSQEGLMLEERIVQHPDLEALSPGCVNTLRINAARDRQGRVRLIGACLKVGAEGSGADNFHSGGLAFPIDLREGRISAPGRDNSSLKDYTTFPVNGAEALGFQIPHWGASLDLVHRAMDQLSSLGYVGWDIAIREDGPILVEGNIGWPGGNIIQLDGRGKYPLILECIGDSSEEHIDG